MCYSFEASVFAGSISYISSFILLARNQGYDRWLAFFILSFSSIQWAEAALWKNINNLTINQFITNWLIPVILASEGLASLGGANMYHDVNLCLWILYIMVAVTIILCAGGSKITTIADGSLSWGTSDNIMPQILFSLYLILPFYFYMDDDLDKIVIILGIFGLLLYSMINNNKSISSNWCYYANFLSVFALVRPYIQG